MEFIRTYDYLAMARSKILDWARPLSPHDHMRTFPIGRSTLLQTLPHVMTSEWYYVQRLEGRDVPPYAQWPIREEEPPAFAALEAAWSRQAAQTRAALSGVREWSSGLEYQVTDDNGRRILVNASKADLVTQLILHEVHHRAQAMNMLRQLGVKVDDIDFNALMYKRTPVG